MSYGVKAPDHQAREAIENEAKPVLTDSIEAAGPQGATVTVADWTQNGRPLRRMILGCLVQSVPINEETP